MKKNEEEEEEETKEVEKEEEDEDEDTKSYVGWISYLDPSVSIGSGPQSSFSRQVCLTVDETEGQPRDDDKYTDRLPSAAPMALASNHVSFFAPREARGF